MKKVKQERRKYYRYDTEMKVYFRVSYDVRTKVMFQVIDIGKKKNMLKKHPGISKNISVEGLYFVSKKELAKGDILLLEVYAPNTKVPNLMEGEVRWSHKNPKDIKYKDMFHTGVKLITVNGKSVTDSIYHDKKYEVDWSIVLEAVFGSFKKMIKHLKENEKTIDVN